MKTKNQILDSLKDRELIEKVADIIFDSIEFGERRFSTEYGDETICMDCYGIADITAKSYGDGWNTPRETAVTDAHVQFISFQMFPTDEESDIVFTEKETEEFRCEVAKEVENLLLDY